MKWSGYNDRAAQANEVLKHQVALADELAIASSVGAAEAVTGQILDEMCSTQFDDTDRAAIVDAFARIVLYACTASRERGFELGARQTKDSIAERLGLA